jgi:hypothetical protein
MTWSRISITRDRSTADAFFLFDDRTVSQGKTPIPQGVTFNYNCHDISKSHVAKIFKEVFNYDLSVDPKTWQDLLVRKSETNASHDGMIIRGPAEEKRGYSYQKLIDTVDGDQVVDFRCSVICGQVEAVFTKRRPVSKRFGNKNSSVKLSSVETIFNTNELKKIEQFCHAMHLDWGGIDVLRDRHDGKIYIVDVNKTNVGPPRDLSMREKITATRSLGNKLRAHITKTSV